MTNSGVDKTRALMLRCKEFMKELDEIGFPYLDVRDVPEWMFMEAQELTRALDEELTLNREEEE